MADISRKRFRRASITFWMLLLYIIAALVWWFISLENQNQQIGSIQYKNIQFERTAMTAEQYADKLAAINKETRKNSGKYISEGVTFLLLILVGAFFVYRSVRKQFKLQHQQQNFMMAVTHELKTPISVSKLNLETLQKHKLGPEKEKKLIQATLDEIERLDFLTNNILLSSQLDGGRYKFTKEDLDFSDLLKDCINDFKSRYPDRIFHEQIEINADVKGDPLLLQMLISNLLQNAVKYAPKETAVTIILKNNPTTIVLQVIDKGTGIPEEEKKKIFSKFYRIGNESTRKTQGTGLGLYLCQKIARDHNADIMVTNNDPGGSKFVVTFKTNGNS